MKLISRREVERHSVHSVRRACCRSWRKACHKLNQVDQLLMQEGQCRPTINKSAHLRKIYLIERKGQHQLAAISPVKSLEEQLTASGQSKRSVSLWANRRRKSRTHARARIVLSAISRPLNSCEQVNQSIVRSVQTSWRTLTLLTLRDLLFVTRLSSKGHEVVHSMWSRR